MNRKLYSSYELSSLFVSFAHFFKSPAPYQHTFSMQPCMMLSAIDLSSIIPFYIFPWRTDISKLEHYIHLNLLPRSVVRSIVRAF